MTNSETNGGSEWRERRMGKEKPVLPQGSRVKRLKLDTLTDVEYGEKTWTTGQTVRDILQNHLDAHTEQFFQQIVAKVIDTGKLEKIALSDKDLKDFDDFTYKLYLYRLGLGDRTPETETEMLSKLRSLAYNGKVPIRQEFLNLDDSLNPERLHRALAQITENPLSLSFKVYDQTDGTHKEKWVDHKTLVSGLQYQELLPPNQSELSEPVWESDNTEPKPNFRYKISGIEVSDSGGGFDNTLTAFYKSTKTGKRHLRGKFGEGDKMSRAHLVRHGATLRSRSRYFINGGQSKERWWQHRPFLDPEDQKVKNRGVEVEMPKTAEARFGSSSRIDAKGADRNFSQNFSSEVDPRDKTGGLAANCLEFSSTKYYYPGGNEASPVGVSLAANPEFQYVQGLRVGDANEKVASNFNNKRLFSYNFLDSSLLKGRDRNEINDKADSEIKDFWKQAESPELLTALITRVYIEGAPEPGHSSNNASYSEDVIFDRLLKFPTLFPRSQSSRVKRLCLDLFPKVLGLEPGAKYVLVSKMGPAEQKLIPLLTKRGYTILPIRTNISKESLAIISAHHKYAFELDDFETIKKLMQHWNLNENLKPEQLEILKPIFTSAMQEFQKLLVKLGLQPDNLEAEPEFVPSVDAAKEQPVEIQYIFRSKKFRLRLRPELVFGDKSGRFDAAYWQDRMVVELMSTVGRTDEFKERLGALQHAQETAQALLDQSSSVGQEELSRLLASFRYKEGEERKFGGQFWEKLKDINEALQAWAALEQARNLNLSLAGFELLVKASAGFPPKYKNECEDLLSNKIVIENGMVGFCIYQVVGKELEYRFQKIPLSELEVCGQVEGRKIYRISGKTDRLFMVADLPEGTVVQTKEQKSVIFGNQVTIFSGKNISSYGYYGMNRLHINGQCLSTNSHIGDRDKKLTVDQKGEAVKEFAEELGEYKIIYPEKSELKSARTLTGRVETPLSIDYGKDEWNNPARVFQDIAQNHLDAVPDRQITLQFEVLRKGNRFWIDKEEIDPDDLIVGFAILDDGDGYAPDDIGTIGKSSKKSPLFAGKYGEGQKMIAAAAVRNGLDLRFSSVASQGGKKYRWVGAAGTQAQEIIINGEPTQEQRVVFNLTSQEAVADGMTSMTAIRLPDDPSRYNDEEWKRWVKIIDPRIKDQFGNEGLSRYILNLRRQDRQEIIDMGFIKILLDEPGAVYENGLLVAKGKNLAFGYSVPELVSTRERNSYDEDKLSSYISYVYSHCQDPRFAARIITKFKQNYLPSKEKGFAAYIKEQDLNFQRLSLHQMDSKPYWDLACAQQLPGTLVVSKDWLQHQISLISRDFQKHGSGPPDIERLTKLQMTLANLAHIPEDQLMEVENNYYLSFANIFPTAESFTLSLAEQEIEVDKTVSAQLRLLVGERGFNLSAMLANIANTPEYAKLLTQSTETPNPHTLKTKTGQVFEQSLFWSNRDALDLHPESVFVAPATAGYLGVITKDRLGINETLFTSKEIRKLVGTIDHELVHKITGLADYEPEFIIALLKLAKHNFGVV